MLNKLLLFCLSAHLLYANSMLTQYRKTGELLIEKELDYELAQTKYWDEYLEDVDTTLGYSENLDAILVCNKNKAILNVYKKNKNNQFVQLKQYHAFTGQKQGDKVREGDLKTPHGVYDITKKISKLDSFYGPLAFVTSYPNLYDTYRGKNGSGIWIHGLPIEQERDEYTKGCIAINNSNIECLDRNIDIDSTLLIIAPDEINKNVTKQTYVTILSNLYAWRYSWLYNDIDTYLSFYSNDFRRYDGMKFTRFQKYKTRIFKKEEKKKIIFKDINVIPYPDSDNIFKITFKELYKSKSFKFEGDKVLIVKVDGQNKFQILTEK